MSKQKKESTFRFNNMQTSAMHKVANAFQAGAQLAGYFKNKYFGPIYDDWNVVASSAEQICTLLCHAVLNFSISDLPDREQGADSEEVEVPIEASSLDECLSPPAASLIGELRRILQKVKDLTPKAPLV